LKISVDEIDANVEVIGGEFARSVLYLHGWHAGLTSLKCVAAYADTFENILIDLPDGQTYEPKRIYTLDDYVEFVVFILKRLEIKKTNIVAHSFGGRIALLLSVKYPDLVDKMILTACAGVKPKKTLKYRFKIFRYKLCKLLVRLKLVRKARLQRFGSEDYKKLSDSMKQTFKNIVNTDLTKILKDVAAPSLIVFAKDDNETPVYMAKILNKNIKNSGLVLYEKGGHFGYAHNINSFAAAMLHFFNN
jgi:pimeloyl-ACP methyl ester carboxylesterase